MILAIDIGNTETTMGLFRDRELAEHWRFTTEQARTPDEIGLLFRSFMSHAAMPIAQPHGIVVCSVVPLLTGAVLSACERWLGRRAVLVDAAAALPIRLDVDEPLTVGADRIVNTLAASRIFSRDTIVVDLGTATTFDCITKEGVFLGGVIAPGVRIAAETLFRRTSKLPAPDFAVPERIIGRRTEECLRAGIIFGAADSIDGIVRRIKMEWPNTEDPLVVATGGLAETLAPHVQTLDRVEPFLTLYGLRLAHEIMSEASR